MNEASPALPASGEGVHIPSRAKHCTYRVEGSRDRAASSVGARASRRRPLSRPLPDTGRGAYDRALVLSTRTLRPSFAFPLRSFADLRASAMSFSSVLGLRSSVLRLRHSPIYRSSSSRVRVKRSMSLRNAPRLTRHSVKSSRVRCSKSCIPSEVMQRIICWPFRT